MEVSQSNPLPKLISLTLPVACQICLGKVKEPIVCPNQHVFCSICMEVWLRTNKQCPTCRTPITAEQPCKKIVVCVQRDSEVFQNNKTSPGKMQSKYWSLDTAETPPDADTRANLRRTRLELIRQDYEEEISSIQSMNDDLREENQKLNQQVVELKSLAKHTTGSSGSHSPVSEGELDTLMKLTAKLQEASGTYDSLKQDLKKLKQDNEKLRNANIQLMGENAKLREDGSFNKSPQKFSRYTVVALQAKVDLYEREIQQLKRALERSDYVIAQLRKEDGLNEQSTESVADSVENIHQTLNAHSSLHSNSFQVNSQCSNQNHQMDGMSSLPAVQHHKRSAPAYILPKNMTQETRGFKEQNSACCPSPSKRKVVRVLQHPTQAASYSPSAQWNLTHSPVVSSSPVQHGSPNPLIVSSYSHSVEQSALASLSSMTQNIVSSETASHLEPFSHSLTTGSATSVNTPGLTANGILQMKTSPVATSTGELLPLGLTVVPTVQSTGLEDCKENNKDLPELPADTENRFPAIARLRQLKRALIKDKEEQVHSPQSPFAQSPASSTSGRASTELPHQDFYDMYSSQLPSPWGKPTMVATGYSYSPVGTSNPSENTEVPHSTCPAGMIENGTKKIKTENEEPSGCSYS